MVAFRTAIFIALSIYVVKLCSANCPDSWVAYETKCYYVVPGLYSYMDAVVECQRHNGSIAIVETKKFNDFIVENLTFFTVWVGAERRGLEKDYRWRNGNYIKFANWRSSIADNIPFFKKEPNCDSMCCAITINGDGEWSDESCLNDHGLFCERSLSPTGNETEFEWVDQRAESVLKTAEAMRALVGMIKEVAQEEDEFTKLKNLTLNLKADFESHQQSEDNDHHKLHDMHDVDWLVPIVIGLTFLIILSMSLTIYLHSLVKKVDNYSNVTRTLINYKARQDTDQGMEDTVQIV